jgi:hypothetical protein
MRNSLRFHLIAAIVGFGYFAGAGSAWAQKYLIEAAQQQQEPRWLTLDVDHASIGLFAEAFHQTTTTTGSGSYDDTRTFIGPSLGLGVNGSIYHPNLASYRLTLDGSYGNSVETFSSPVGSGTTKEKRFLGFFTGEMRFLDSKPFNARLDASYTHSYQDYDFFNRIYIDTWRYGGSAYYTSGPWRFSTRVSRTIEDATGNEVPWTSDTRLALFDVNHQRTSGSTYLSAAYSDFNRTDSGVESTGRDYGLTLSDEESFGSRRQFHSTVAAVYDRLESTTAPTDLYSISASLRGEHSHDLTSYNQLTYAHNTFGEAVNDTWNGSSSISHHLFESLVSTMTLQGYYYSNENGQNTQDSWQLSATPDVQYNKRLTSSSSLSAYESFGFSHTDIKTTGGIIQINAESHTFGVGALPDFFTLKEPNVVPGSIRITATASGLPPVFIEGIDYEVVPNGELTMIHRLPGSTIPPTATVFANYQFVAGSSGAYDTLDNACGIRFNFFNDLWSVYSRLNIRRNYGADNLVVEDLNDLIVGSEVRWRRTQAGLEYEKYDSSISPYDAFRLFQIFTFVPDEYSTASLNLTESYFMYSENNRSEQNYRAVVRYHRRLTYHLRVNLETGVNKRIGQDVDETLAVFRPELTYEAGDFSATVGYDYGYDEYLNSSTHISNRGYIRLRKQF